MTTAADRAPVVTVEHVSKRFRTPEEATHTLKERVLHPLRRRSHRELVGLRDVSFAVRQGEFFGIVGRNGSGKSTLLKCLAGIYGVDSGHMYRRGRMSTFIELGVGFNPDLAAYDNVVLNGIMMGLSAAEAKARYRQIIEFAELEEFEELKLKNYSSGMHVRLAFSVAVQVDADIMLVDEVLAVGDAAFQQKCFDVFNRLRAEGKTILFVTHDMAAVQRLCHRALLLEQGEVVAIGDPEEVGDRYLELNFTRATGPVATAERPGDGAARIIDGWLEDEAGERVDQVLHGSWCVFRALVHFDEPVDDPSLTVAFRNEHGHNVLIATTIIGLDETGSFRRGEQVRFSVRFENVLAPGRYEPVANLAHRGTGHRIMDRWEEQMSFVVRSAQTAGGLVDVPYTWSVERISSDEQVSHVA